MGLSQLKESAVATKGLVSFDYMKGSAVGH